MERKEIFTLAPREFNESFSRAKKIKSHFVFHGFFLFFLLYNIQFHFATLIICRVTEKMTPLC